MEEWGTMLAVAGMLAATLVAATVANRYQAHQAKIRDTVRSLERGISALNDALSALARVPLSRELRLVFRGEVVARNRRVRALARRTPGIDQRIRAAEAAMQAEGGTPPGGVGPIENEQAFRRLVAALDDLLAMLQHARLLQPVPADVRGIFIRELGERRAEVLARFHLIESHRREEAGDLLRARAHITTLMHGLRQRGPSTDFVRELYREAETALSELSQRHVGAPAGAPG